MKYSICGPMLIVALSCTLVALLIGCRAQSIDRGVVEGFDVESFLGRWYEIARLDNRFERGMSDVVAEYSMLPNGKIEVVNSGVKDGKRTIARGKAKMTSVPGRLRVSFFLFFYSDYNVLAMGERGEWALVGSRSPKYLWILAREPHLADKTLQDIVAIARSRGYATDKLIYDNH